MQPYLGDQYEENDLTGNDGSNLIRDLRAQIKKANEDLKAAQQTINDQSKAIRERTVTDVLAARGVPAKVARLIPPDIEASEGALSQWLDEYRDLFGGARRVESTEAQNQGQPPEGGDAGGSGNQPGVDELAARRMQNAMTGGTTAQPRLDDLINQVSKASPAELLAMIQASKNGA